MRRLVVFGFVTLAAVAAGCRHKIKTPEEAYQRFAEAVAAGDGAALFDALDQKTRWDWMTVQKYHREAYDIVLSNYPEGPDRQRESHRFEPAATATSGRELFRVQGAPGVLKGLLPLAGGDAHVEAAAANEEGKAVAVLPTGIRVPLAKGEDGSWGYAGLARDAEDQKTRAYHDLEVVRASAADYERAATRAGK